MASRSGLSGFPVNPSTPINPSMNPMNPGHSSAMRMPGMPHNSPFRGMGSNVTPNQYHQCHNSNPQILQSYTQRSSMSRGMPIGGMGSMGSPLPGPSYSGAMPMRPGMPQAAMDPSRKRLLQQQPGGLMGPRRGLHSLCKGNKGIGGYTQRLYRVMKLNRTAVILQIFGCPRMRFSDIPMKLASLLQHPDPIVINHIISVDPNDQKKTACFDIDVEVDDPLKAQMTSFLSSTTSQQEITALEMKIHETIESINQLKTQRDFMLSFSNYPQDFIQDWLKSQSRDLKLMTDTVGNPEEERRTDFYHSPWVKEAVGRYIFSKVQQRRQELEQVLGIRLT
ncbi:SWI/SNF-related matrix-associated actin-dependent regulator of chromatin subfamily D member 2-like [Sinocyclocheilus rhinocerous]|nr:PREDICTED: SWI/SNF-related matrix-associated actin-dependent regulator of chromatin subfamily D member 2-like [Sinocyclocheilus rhinocerous]